MMAILFKYTNCIQLNIVRDLNEIFCVQIIHSCIVVPIICEEHLRYKVIWW